MWQIALQNRFLNYINKIRCGEIYIITPDAQTHFFQGSLSGRMAVCHIHDWRAILAMISKGDVGLTQAYCAGWFDTPNLTELLALGIENEDVWHGFLHGSLLSRTAARILYLLRSNTQRRSQRNIHEHYDLGNAFYGLWLDESMTYSCALYRHQDESLEQAQTNKYERILSQLGSETGQLLDIGCGWGGLLEYASQKYQFDAKGITISKEQCHFAQHRLGQRAHIALEDYRNQNKRYDHIVSVEMFEAVGERYWKIYFQKIKSLLKQQGKAIIQTITIDDEIFTHYRKRADMLRTYIFPGGMLPSPKRFTLEANHSGLGISDSFSFGQDYARTLQQWLQRFEAKSKQIYALGFDEHFMRLWRFYLCACIAGFSYQRTDVFQFELRHL